jgi:hypothetical protein
MTTGGLDGIDDLVDPTDPDWASYNNQDPDWFLHVASAAIRKYCGWHIFPSLTLTIPNLPIQSRGAIIIPATYVTNVESVTIQDPTNQNPMLLDPTQYTWFDYGAVEPIGWHWWSAYGGFYYGPDNWSFLPIYQYGLATVVCDAGYDECPADVKEVAFELTTTTTEVAAGNVKEVQTPGFRLQLMQAYGATLTADQKNRLANYRIGMYK